MCWELGGEGSPRGLLGNLEFKFGLLLAHLSPQKLKPLKLGRE